MGASTKSIIFKHITDSVFLNLVALLVSFIIVFFLINQYEGLLGRELNLSTLINYKFILITITANLIFGVIGGVLPVLFLLKLRCESEFRKELTTTKKDDL